MRVKVYFHGHLRDKINKEFIVVDADTAYEALKVIASKYHQQLKAPLDIGRWKVVIKNYDTKESWYVPLFSNELHVYPIFKTSKSQWLNIAIGATLMVLAPYMAPNVAAGTTMTTAQQLAAGASSFSMSTGIALVLSGVMNLIFPAPTLNTSSEASTNSKYLSATGNTVAAGTRIPFGYGLFKVSGHFISYNISSTVVKVIDKEEGTA